MVMSTHIRRETCQQDVSINYIGELMKISLKKRTKIVMRCFHKNLTKFMTVYKLK
jgi:hypothetical protein